MLVLRISALTKGSLGVGFEVPRVVLKGSFGVGFEDHCTTRW